MKENYLDIVDSIIMKAYTEGSCFVEREVWKVYAVKNRLDAYGKDDALGRFFLNERGIEYAISGCSKGIRDRIRRQEEIERLEIETKTFTKKKQKTQFAFSVISLILSILAFFGGFEALQGLLSKLLAIVESLCNS